MRIVYLNKVLMDEHLPAVNFSLQNAIGLAQAGAETYLLVQRKSAALTPDALFARFGLKPLRNLHVMFFTKKRRFGITTNQWFYLWAVRQIRKLHRQKPVSAVISRDPGALPYLARLRRRPGIPGFYQPHNFYADLSLRPDVNPRNARKYHLLEAKWISKIDGLLCLQESQAKWYKKYFPGKTVFVSKPGVLQIKERRNDRFARRIVGYVGSLQLKKGVDDLLRAFAELRMAESQLWLVGGRSAAEIDPVRELARELGVENQVKITGWLPFTEVESYLQEFSIGVLPLKDTFYNRYLTAPNKLFDYLSHGIPVVASDLPAIINFIRNGKEGLLVAPGDPHALSAAIRKLLSDPALFRTLETNALRRAADFLWEKRAAVMLRQIAAVTGQLMEDPK